MKRSQRSFKKETVPLERVPRMVPWKQAIITAVGVYPLLLSYEWLVKEILPVELMGRRLTLFIVVILIATTMVFLVMPLLVRILGPWLFKKQNYLKRKQ